MIDHFVDIYAKLLIGIVSLTAPITSYLLANYIKGRVELLKRLSEQDNTSKKLMGIQMKEAVEKGEDAVAFIREKNRELETKDLEVQKKIKILKYLEPKKRILWLFIPLFISLILLLFDVLVRDDAFDCWYNHCISVCLLSSSCIIFVFSMSMFWHLVWKLIDAKEILKGDEMELILEEESPVVESKQNPVAKP